MTKHVLLRYKTLIGILNGIIISFSFAFIFMNSRYMMLIENGSVATISNTFAIDKPLQNLTPFQFTCISFPILCKDIKLQNISKTNDECYFALAYLLNNMQLLSPLFVLSFRREFFFNVYQQKSDQNHSDCFNKIIFDFLKPFNEVINNKKRSKLFHAHISKAGGTRFRKDTEALAKLFNYTKLQIPREKPHYYGRYIFKGFRSMKSIKPFPTCSTLFDEINSCNITLLRFENEAPLTNNRLCPQFYNSIIIRDPIEHRLSMLAFQTNFRTAVANIYYNDSNNNLVACSSNQEMKGFITDLYHRATMGVSEIKQLQYDHKIKKLGMNIEWINGYGNMSRFAIGTNRKNLFNANFLIGLLSNTYSRWIGYDHIDSRNIVDCIFANYSEIEKHAHSLET